MSLPTCITSYRYSWLNLYCYPINLYLISKINTSKTKSWFMYTTLLRIYINVYISCKIVYSISSIYSVKYCKWECKRPLLSERPECFRKNNVIVWLYDHRHFFLFSFSLLESIFILNNCILISLIVWHFKIGI